MWNMWYCRFRNTLGDLRDCRENIGDIDSIDEFNAMVSLAKEALDFIDELGLSNSFEWDELFDLSKKDLLEELKRFSPKDDDEE